jgi:hypothetical protein
MKKILLIIFTGILFTGNSFSQESYTDSISKNAIKKLQFLTGNWEGEGWIMDPTGKKFSFQQTEVVQFKLDSTSVLMEGKGSANEQVRHHAMAVVRYDKNEKTYKINTYLANGHGGNFSAEQKNDEFHWYPSENMRYIIKINDRKWVETGEMKRDGSWFQFFQMDLTKQ